MQRNVALLAIGLFFIKIIAWWLTRSVAIFTDAMESTVNVATGLIGWYSVWLAAKPRDVNHPYGHGKAEFISAAIEGTLIFIAGIIIVYEAIQNLRHPKPIGDLNIGLFLLGATAVINFVAGRAAVNAGKKVSSIALEAGGKHLITDTYSTIGIILGLVLLKLTNWLWLDAAIALAVAAIILVTGYRVVRKSLAGIMDEADFELLKELIGFLEQQRKPQWIDLHNLRIIQYGNILHLDGHITLPWYFNVNEAHAEIETLDKLIKQKFGNAVELFVHVDGCMPYSCSICSIANCKVRTQPNTHHIVWTTDNVLQNSKHRADT